MNNTKKLLIAVVSAAAMFGTFGVLKAQSAQATVTGDTIITEKQSNEIAKKQWDDLTPTQKTNEIKEFKRMGDKSVLNNKKSPEYKYEQKLKKSAAYKASKLASKKTKSNKYVAVSGKFVISNKVAAKKHKATYVRVMTYKGYKYLKLTKSLTFKKNIYAPKAKSTWFKAGYYTKGKFHGLSTSKKVSVKQLKTSAK